MVTNGATFSKPQAVGTILGLFTIMAIAGSLMTTVYGDHLPTIRKHHAHSLSIFVVFAVFHHIFFTGALSMNWPSVLSAFWSNYAWAGGMIYSERMQNTINKFLGSNQGNTSYVGAASSGADSNTVGGTVPIQAIYKRAHLASSDPYHLENSLHSRDLVNASTGYPWYGVPAKPGMPLPGNYSGFAGTLSAESIPASNAFMTGFLWLLILLLIVAAMTAAFKWALEGLIALKLLRNDRLVYYRTHWVGFTVVAVLRTVSLGSPGSCLITLTCIAALNCFLHDDLPHPLSIVIQRLRGRHGLGGHRVRLVLRRHPRCCWICVLLPPTIRSLQLAARQAQFREEDAVEARPLAGDVS